jgi:acetoin utilization protein AcuB
MIVKDWMTKNPITVDPDTSMMRASKLMKEHSIRRLPVLENGKLVGIVSDRDIKEASPSKATTLDVHELYYLLSEVKVRDIMTKNPITVNENETILKCAAIMQNKKISGLPVLDDQGSLVGIVSETEIYKVLLSITGVHHGGVQFGVTLRNEQGTLKEVLDTIRNHKGRVISILTSYDNVAEGYRNVYIRIHDMEKAALNELKENLQQKYSLSFWVRDAINPIV